MESNDNSEDDIEFHINDPENLRKRAATQIVKRVRQKSQQFDPKNIQQFNSQYQRRIGNVIENNEDEKKEEESLQVESDDRVNLMGRKHSLILV